MIPVSEMSFREGVAAGRPTGPMAVPTAGATRRASGGPSRSPSLAPARERQAVVASGRFVFRDRRVGWTGHAGRDVAQDASRIVRPALRSGRDCAGTSTVSVWFVAARTLSV